MTNANALISNTALTAEEFDGETVLLDVVRGLYFSLSGAAVELWRAFQEPRAALEAIDAVCAGLAGADRTALLDAVQSMCDNQLLVPAEGIPGNDPAPFIPVASAFVSPRVEVFNDLADLISIDPVHEVNAATGWPVRPASFPDVG